MQYYYNPPTKAQDVYRQETLYDGLSGRPYSVLARDELASSPMVPFDPPMLTINTTHDVDTVQWSPWSESEVVVGFSSWQDIFAYDVAAYKGSAPTRIVHNKNKNVGVSDLAFNKPRGLLVGISRNSSMQFWDLRAASDPVFASTSSSASSSSSSSSSSSITTATAATSSSSSSSSSSSTFSSSSLAGRSSPFTITRSSPSSSRASPSSLSAAISSSSSPPSHARSGVKRGRDAGEREKENNRERENDHERGDDHPQGKLVKRRRVDKSNLAEAMASLVPRGASTGVRKRASPQNAEDLERRRRQKEASLRFYLQPKQAFDLPLTRVRGNYSCLQVSDDGNLVYIGTETGDIHVYDFRKPLYALHTYSLGSYAMQGFTTRDAECGISSLLLDPHHADRLYFHLSWSAISGLVDLTKGHEGVVALYRPPGASSAAAGEARTRQPASTGTESLMPAASAPPYPYPNASRGSAALTTEGAYLCGGSYSEGRYTISIADMESCRVEGRGKAKPLVIDLVTQRYDPPTAAAIAARLSRQMGRRGISGHEEEARKDAARKRAVHIEAVAPVTCVATHPRQPFVLAGTTANRLLVASQRQQNVE